MLRNNHSRMKSTKSCEYVIKIYNVRGVHVLSSLLRDNDLSYSEE